MPPVSGGATPNSPPEDRRADPDFAQWSRGSLAQTLQPRQLLGQYGELRSLDLPAMTERSRKQIQQDMFY
jgi:hypothetical protein